MLKPLLSQSATTPAFTRAGLMELPLSLIAGALFIGGMFTSLAALADSEDASAQVDALNQSVQEQLLDQLTQDNQSQQAEHITQYQDALTEYLSSQPASNNDTRRRIQL